jgi:sugar/nucleoside kinase (ribokinase family)
MPTSFAVVVAGHICLDIIPTLASDGFVFSPGQLLEVGPAILSTGGPVSNTGLALHKLGITTRLMGKVGDDFFGRTIQRIIEKYSPKLTEGMIEVQGETSSYTIILSPSAADRMLLHCPGCNDTFGSSDIDYESVSAAQLFHFGYPPVMKRTIESNGAELIELFKRAKATGVTTSLDMCMPDPRGVSGGIDWRVVVSATLPHVDIYLPSLEETLFMLYPEKFRNFSLTSLTPELLSSVGLDLLSMGPMIVGLKLGALGFYLRTASAKAWKSMGRATPENLEPWLGRELWSPCFDTAVVGTTGAGDATIAGLLAALLRGHTPEESATLACAVGGCNVEAADALSGLRTWEQTEARVRAGWPRKRLSLGPSGWESCKTAGVWYSPKDRRLTIDD